MNRGSEYDEYPFYIADFNPKNIVNIPKSDYFKYLKNVYYFNYIGYQKLDLLADKFVFDSLKIDQGNYIHIGYDNKNIYHNSEKIDFEYLQNLPISQNIKDSLRAIYFLK